jgi:hypothetical protein
MEAIAQMENDRKDRALGALGLEGLVQKLAGLVLAVDAHSAPLFLGGQASGLLRHARAALERGRWSVDLPPGDATWGWRTLLQRSDVRIGLMAAHGPARVPVHDHPGSRTVLLVVSGKIRVRSYDLAGAVGQGPLVRLRSLGCREWGPGEMSVAGASRGNIHSVEALTPGVLLLDFSYPPYDDAKRSWYLAPSERGRGTNEITAHRVYQLPSAVASGVVDPTASPWSNCREKRIAP